MQIDQNIRNFTTEQHVEKFKNRKVLKMIFFFFNSSMIGVKATDLPYIDEKCITHE